jgi:hypothetical protein
METHLLFGGRQSFGENVLVVSDLQLGECNCATAFGSLKEAVNVPGLLQHAIKNVRSLFQAAMNDSTNCCDVRPAILAADRCLQILIYRFETSRANLFEVASNVEPRQKAVLGELRRKAATDAVTKDVHAIETWILLGDRVLRQRTIGSFEEFLGQSDRALSYRGGAQKMLFLADCLMNDFYAHAALAPYSQSDAETIEPTPAVFATLYDSVDHIQSQDFTGLVRVPARDVFLLASVLPDLWHEVGVYIFFDTFEAKVFGLNTDIQADRNLYLELADYYGDLIVCVYGFDCLFERFAVSLGRGWGKAVPEHAYAVRGNLAVGVVLRLMVVLGVLFHALNPAAPARGGNLLRHIKAIMTRYFAHDSKLTLTNEIWGRARMIWEGPLFQSVFKVLRDGVRGRDIQTHFEMGEARSAKRQSASRQLVRLRGSNQPNEALAQLYWAIERRRERGKARNVFGVTAAIGRSAVIEYHRRLATKIV